MKIRYYLRGLGLGVLVTAIFFMVSDNSSTTLSDEQIKERARKLGMTESVVLAELPTEETTVEATTIEETVTEETVTEENVTEENVTEENVTEEFSTEEIVTEETTVEEPVEEEEKVTEVYETTVEESVEEETSEEEEHEVTSEAPETEENFGTNTEPVLITVNRGEGSDTVSKRMQDAGLVADAHEYDRYLMTNGYDKRIGAGEHLIPVGATWEDMAKILCNMK